MGRLLALAATLVVLLAAEAVAQTTLDRQIVPAAPVLHEFSFLTYGPGQPRVVREELAPAQEGREERRRTLAYFAQLSDFQLADEESPLRVEFLDKLHPELSSAWRPQEALLPHTVDSSIRQVNANLRSPVRQAGGRRAKLGFAVLTGDNADNQHRNESRWVTRLLEGGTVHPGSGVEDPACGLPPGEAAGYTGVQDFDDYPFATGDYYDPDRPAGQFSAFPQWPGLMDRAQKPFEAAGLDVPSYVAIGNHDGLVQGNEEANAAFEAIATGCVKPVLPAAGGPFDLTTALDRALLADPAGRAIRVPRDPDRTLVDKPEYREILAGRQADAHGFAYVDGQELAGSRGAASYYDFSPAPGLRFIALDTVANGGVTGVTDKGNVDHPQFAWLLRELEAAERADEIVVLFSHHAPVSLTAAVPDEAAGPCVSVRDDPNPGCDLDPRPSTPLHLGADLAETLRTHPRVVAWVAGHSHVNDVAFEKGERGGFWIVRTSAEADFPHQDRLLEVMDNRDGTLSIFGTLIDGAAPASVPPPGTPASNFTTADLASIARTLGHNDPQADPKAPGDAHDRNVELLVPDPRTRRSGGAPAPRRGVVVRVRPNQVRRGRAVRLRVSVRRAGRPVRGAVVRVRGKRVRTGRRGRAVVRVRFKRLGAYRVRARGGSATVLVTRRG